MEIDPQNEALLALIVKNRERIEILAVAGVFDIADGKATVHFKGGLVQGVQVERWAWQRERSQSTPQKTKQVIP